MVYMLILILNNVENYWQLNLSNIIKPQSKVEFISTN